MAIVDTVLAKELEKEFNAFVKQAIADEGRCSADRKEDIREECKEEFIQEQLDGAFRSELEELVYNL